MPRLKVKKDEYAMSWPEDNCSFEDILRKVPSAKTFHIGPNYGKNAATTIACKKCGNRTFNVGAEYCFTAIRCKACKWEFCIHEG